MKHSDDYSNENIHTVQLEHNSKCICPEPSHLSHYGKSTIQSRVLVLHLKAVFKLLNQKKKKKQETSQWNYSKNCVECWNWWGQWDLSVLFHMSWETTSPCCLKQPRHLGGTMCDFCLFNVNVFISVTLGIWYCCSEQVRRLLEFPWKQTKDNVYIQYYSPKCTMCTLEI